MMPLKPMKVHVSYYSKETKSNNTKPSPTIAEIEVEYTSDIFKWVKDRAGRYISHHIIDDAGRSAEAPMTVGELITLLQQLDEDKIVIIDLHTGDYVGKQTTLKRNEFYPLDIRDQHTVNRHFSGASLYVGLPFPAYIAKWPKGPSGLEITG